MSSSSPLSMPPADRTPARNRSLRPSGLGDDEAAERLKKSGPNLLPSVKHKALWRMIAEVLAEPMFLLLIVAAALYFRLGDAAEAIFLSGSVAFVATLTIAQSRRTQRALEALRDLAAPRARVIRNGIEKHISAAEVVVDDVLVLGEGDRICADAKLLDGSLSVDESLLTGESVPVDKSQVEHDISLSAGTVITRGTAIAQVTATGSATAMGRIGQALSTTQEPISILQRDSRRLVWIFAGAALLFAFSLFVLQWLLQGHGPQESLLMAIALAMAILPEEFPVVLTIFLALGAWRIARRGVLTRRVASVETLGTISVLAVDKTGTLTQNAMELAELAMSSETHRTADGPMPPQFEPLLVHALMAISPHTFDPMEKAISAYARQWLPPEAQAAAYRPFARTYELTPALMAMTHAFVREAGEGHDLAAKGAPEAILALCNLPSKERADIDRRIQALAAQGLRVIAVASGQWDSGEWPDSQRDLKYRFLGWLAFRDPPRPDAAAAVSECLRAGIRVIMMTGDHPQTAQAIAAQVGLGNRGNYITGDEIDTWSDRQLARRLADVTVCARVRPLQKLRLVRAFQQLDHVVGMTGDGVNDAPALKAADVGVAMGRRGTDVAREAAALVLLDDSFSSLVSAIRQGRLIYDNIAKASRFIVAVHAPIVALAIVPSLLGWPMALTPVAIVMLEIVIDPACSIVFESAHASGTLMTRLPRTKEESPFFGGNLWTGIAQGTGIAAVLTASYALMNIMGTAPDVARPATFLSLVFSVFLLALANHDTARPFSRASFAGNPRLMPLLLSVLALMAAILLIPILSSMLGFANVSPQAHPLAALIAAVSGGWLALLAAIQRLKNLPQVRSPRALIGKTHHHDKLRLD
ncbi:MAG TPA: cation-translocating P-type ATPase [Dyella sp.]|uniref:cation-translocating P-type ATPase n=1 Tax=Dyella sp. TaxID=1869338 RepID=UPI002F934F46